MPTLTERLAAARAGVAAAAAGLNPQDALSWDGSTLVMKDGRRIPWSGKGTSVIDSTPVKVVETLTAITTAPVVVPAAIIAGRPDVARSQLQGVGINLAGGASIGLAVAGGGKLSGLASNAITRASNAAIDEIAPAPKPPADAPTIGVPTGELTPNIPPGGIAGVKPAQPMTFGAWVRSLVSRFLRPTNG